MPGQPTRTSGMAIASLVFGVISLPMIFVCLGLFTGLLGIVFGIIALVAVSKGGGQVKGRGMAWAGILLSVAAFGIYGVFLAYMSKESKPFGSEAYDKFEEVERTLSAEPGSDGSMTEDEKKVAIAFLEDFTTLHALSVEREQDAGKGLEPTELKGEAEVACRITDRCCMILVRVPEYRRHTEDAKKSVSEMAWMVAVSAVESLDPPLDEDVVLVVGLKGMAQYGAIMTGSPTAVAPEKTDNKESRLHEFFQDAAEAP